jgi:carboxypeptidase family protein/uncharacterized protein DUF3761
MKRVSLRVALIALCSTIVACSNSGVNPGAPTSPTPTPTPSATVRSVTLTSAATSSSSYQVTAKADMSDGSSRDVTTQSQWTTSDATLATISSTGVLTVLRSGQVAVRATYLSVTGALTLALTAPQPPASGLIVLSGTASETPPAAKRLSGVTVRITDGPAAGQSIVTDAQGQYGFIKVPSGSIGLEATKDGYVTWRLTNLTVEFDRQIDIVMYPTPPKDNTGATATARCNDGSWSWAQTRAAACTANGGVAYTVCPGPICDSQTAR